MLTTLLTYAAIYGPQAVNFVLANSTWLVPLGGAAITLITQIFG